MVFQVFLSVFCYFLSLKLEEKVFPSPESTHVVNENEVKDSDAASDSSEEDWFLYHLIIFNSFCTCLQGARNTPDSK